METKGTSMGELETLQKGWGADEEVAGAPEKGQEK